MLVLTVNVCEGTEDAARTVARLLNVVTLGALVYLRVELLLRAGVTVAAQVSRLTVTRLSPLVSVLHVRTRSRSGQNVNTSAFPSIITVTRIVSSF